MYQKQLLVIKTVLITLIFFALSPSTLKSQTLSKGDVVIIGLNVDGAPEELALLALTNITTSQSFYLTDYPVTTAGGTTLDSSNGTNGSVLISPTSTILAGTVFTISIAGSGGGVSVSGASVSTTFTGWTSSTPASGAGDSFHIFNGSGFTSVSSFVYAFSTTSSMTTNLFDPGVTLSSTESYLGAGLAIGTDALALTGSDHLDNIYYTGAVTGTVSTLLGFITNRTNYTGDNTTTYDITVDGSSVFNGGAVTINPGFTINGAGDTDPPTFDSAPATSSITTSGFTVDASIDEGGDIYYVVVADGDPAPTTANVLGGVANGGGAAIKSGSGTNLADPFTLSSAVTGLSAGIAYDVYVVAQDDESTPNVQAAVTLVNVKTLAPTSLAVAATVFLEGAWNGSTAMNTTLEDGDLVASSAPYNGTNNHAGSESVANAAAVPNGAVDWVLVELREAGSAAGANNTTRKGSAAGFLMSDGSIKATDGTSNLTISLSGNTGADYYVVIYHRNHLPIMSASAISGTSGTLTIDYTGSSANTYQTTTALASLAGGKFGMAAGDFDQDGNIDVDDLETWRTNNGAVYSYSGSGIADFNLDGVINAVDRNDFHQKNTSKTRQVPST